MTTQFFKRYFTAYRCPLVVNGLKHKLCVWFSDVVMVSFSIFRNAIRCIWGRTAEADKLILKIGRSQCMYSRSRHHRPRRHYSVDKATYTVSIGNVLCQAVWETTIPDGQQVNCPLHVLRNRSARSHNLACMLNVYKWMKFFFCKTERKFHFYTSISGSKILHC